jgi:hypothetical protein
MLSETAYQSAPHRIGPYTFITRLDFDTSRVPVPEKRFIARSADGARTVLLCVPHPGADAGRFLADPRLVSFIEVSSYPLNALSTAAR